ncbi:MAG: nuclear transport factor 2 family protein [Beijerinckiaceae bacterium]
MNADLQPRAVADAFYQAMAARDFSAMGKLYDDCSTFTDPAFGTLDAANTRAMWRMLLSRSKDISVSHTIESANDTQAVTRWVAHYSFSKTGRPVKNIIVATMEIRDGKIIRHSDDFDIQDWLRQALGWPGFLFGWLPVFRRKVSAGAVAQLAAFIQREKGGA